MKETAFVTEIQGKYAKVTLQRKSACSACHKEGGCFESCKSAVTALAENKAGASVGDLVVVESATKTVILFAFIMYVIPLILSVAAATAVYILTEKDILCALTLIAFLGLYYIVLNPIIKKINKKRNVLYIVEIL